MKFKSLPVTSLEDATIDFEQIQTQGIFTSTTLGGALSGTLPNPSLATGTVLQLAATGTTRKVAFGVANISFTASAQSAGATVTHGLGTTPVVVTATLNLGAGNFGVIVYVSAATGTTFVVAGDRPAGAVTASFPVSWIAIG